MAKIAIHKRKAAAAGTFFVLRALDRAGHTRAEAIAIARRRIAVKRQGYSHRLIVAKVSAVVKLRKITTIAVEVVKRRQNKRRNRH